jgi:hypothetical protein
MTFIEAQDLALRYHCKLPDYHENHPKARTLDRRHRRIAAR